MNSKQEKCPVDEKKKIYIVYILRRRKIYIIYIKKKIIKMTIEKINSYS